MNIRTDLQSYYDESLKCVRCGLCQAVCPVFDAQRNESSVARGKVQIVRALLEERVPASATVRERVFLCLNCEACVANCPSGVAVTEIVMAARAQLARDLGRPALERLVLRDVLAHPERMELGGAALALYERTGLRWLAHKLGVLQLLPAQLGSKEGMLPARIGVRSARRVLANGASGARSGVRVAYFLGCVTNILFQSLAIDVVEVLERNGCQVVVPDLLFCCGVPHRNYGDVETADRLERTNTTRLNAVAADAIVTDCATCGAALRSYSGLNAPVYDVNEFLADRLNEGLSRHSVDLRVTYHDPCHLARGQGVRDAPRRLLNATPGAELVEMEESDRCCGSAGTFGLLHYDLSMRVLDRKMGNAARTEAEAIATSCPACRMQLAYGLERLGEGAPGRPAPREVVHPVELLARSYRK